MAWLDAKMPVPQFLHHQSNQRRRAAISKLLNMFDLVLPETDTVCSRTDLGVRNCMQC